MDRAGELRTNPEALLAGWESARILHFNGEGFLTAGGALRYVPSYEIPDSAETYFLGEDEKGIHYYVLNSTKFYGHHEDYKTIRELDLNDQEVGLAVHAQGLSLWHTRHPMCSMCGKETVAHLAGSIRKCIRCETDHYPRTDPAIIVLARDKDDRILLGRQSRWPEHRFSTFAGFVEPGESFESAVVLLTNVFILDCCVASILNEAELPPQHNVGATGSVGVVGAVDPALGAMAPNDCPFNVVVPCTSSI